jgi:hypothetical protein
MVISESLPIANPSRAGFIIAYAFSIGVVRGGAYGFGGGVRTGSGRSLAKIALRVRMRGEHRSQAGAQRGPPV